MNFGPGESPNAGLRPHSFRGPAPPPIEPVPPRLADHEMLRCIGRGSYGQVWLARNVMGVYRAVKIVYRKSFESQRPFERELAGIRRFEPISRLHQGFIDVLHVGSNEAEQYFYYIMELGDDEQSGPVIQPDHYEPKTLASEISRRGRIALRECLELGVAITEALAELHRHDLVHRDIKPSNIIFVNGVPKLADIGLVADVKEARSYVGTEGFIPPEGPGTPRADLYSLGKVLYEASTGQDRQDFPELPANWSGSPEYTGLLELNEVILQACKPEPQRRYESASAMHSDLLMVLNGKSVRRLRLLEQRMANLKRIAGIAALILLGLLLVGYQVWREWRDARDARQREVNRNLNYGNRAMESGNLLGSLPYFAEALRLDEGTDRERTHRLRIGSVLDQCPKLTQMWVAPTTVNTVEFSPDGKWILWAGLDGQAEIHNIQTGEMYLHPFGPVPGLRAATFSPDGKFILTASEDWTATLWEMAQLKPVYHLPHTNLVFTARFSSDRRRIVTACGDGYVRVWDAANGRLQFEINAHTNMVLCADFSRDGKLIASASKDKTARLWFASNGLPTGVVIRHGDWVTSVAFSPDNKQLATCSVDRTIRVTDFGTGQRLSPDMKHDGIVETVQYSRDGLILLSSGFDATARLWGSASFQPATSTPVLGHGEPVMCAAFNPDGRLVITACNDGSIRIWDLAGSIMPPASEPKIFSPEGNRYLLVRSNEFWIRDQRTDKEVFHSIITGGTIQSASLNSPGQFAIIGATNLDSAAQRLEIWSVDARRPASPYLTFSNQIVGAVVSDSGKLAAAWQERSAQVWEVDSGKPVTAALTNREKINSAVFSPKAERLALACASNVWVWDIANSCLAYPPLQSDAPLTHIEFSPEGRFLVTCCSQPGLNRSFAQVWDAASGQTVGARLWHGDGVLWANFSRDSRRVVTSGEDFRAKVWSLPHGKQVGLPLRHDNQISAAIFNADGRWIATASGDHTARLWDAETDDPLTPPLQHNFALTGVVFLPEERAIATTDWQGNTRVWPLTIETRSVNDLMTLAQFLAGSRVNADVHPSETNEPPQLVWQQLTNKYPAAFSTSTNEVIAWHAYQATQSEQSEQWRAALFHLQRLLSLRPDDASLKTRLAATQQKLSE